MSHVIGGALGITQTVSLQRLGEKGFKINAADATGGSSKAALNDVIGKPDGFENLGSFIGLQGRNAHLSHDFEHTFADRFLVFIG